MPTRTYYQVLQVDPLADTEVISVVHRRLAQRYHPDRDSSPEARQRMLDINEAWDTLKDSSKRAAYDAELIARRDRRSSDRLVRRPSETGYGDAGTPPRGPATGTVLDFGRYKGWTLSQIARQDPDFLEWLERMPAGRQFRHEIAQLLRRPPP